MGIFKNWFETSFRKSLNLIKSVGRASKNGKRKSFKKVQKKFGPSVHNGLLLLVQHHHDQSDQMVRSFAQCLAIYNNVNFPNGIYFAKVGSKFCQIVNNAFKSCPNTFRN